MLQEGSKDRTETSAQREKSADRACQEKKEILATSAALETLVPWVTAE